MNIVWDYVEEHVSEWLDPPTERQKLRKYKRSLARNIASIQKKESEAAAREAALKAQLFKLADECDESRLRDVAVDAAGAGALRKSLQNSRRVLMGADAKLVAAESAGLVREALAVASEALGMTSRAGVASAQRQAQEFQKQMLYADMVQKSLEDVASPDEEEPDVESLVQQLLADARMRMTLAMPSAGTAARAERSAAQGVAPQGE